MATALILSTIFLTGTKGEEINEVIIFSDREGSNIRLYAKENATSFIYSHITIKIITNSNNSTALIYFNSILKDAFNFSYESIKSYKVNDTTSSITIILNNHTLKYYVRVLKDNINLDNYINNQEKYLKYTEKQVEEMIFNTKVSMLEKTTVGFLIGFIIVAIFLIRRLRNEIQPIL